jgi:steroid delta-isomerase-like uncharacterized protein
MSAEQNKILARKVFDLNNQHDLEKLGNVISPKHILHFGGMPPMDWNGHKQLLSAFHSAFPDFRIDIEDLIAEGDKVTIRMTATGTHKGVFQGIPSTSKKINVTGIAIQRMVEGKVADEWINVDTMSLMQQLGALPSK